MYVINDCWRNIETEVMRKLEDDGVRTELKDKNAWIFEIMTDNKVHAAFLH